MCGSRAPVDERHGYSNGNYPQLKESIATALSLGETELLGVGELHRFLLDLAKWALFKHTTLPARKYLPHSVICAPFKGSRLGFGNRDGIHLVWSGPAATLDAFRGERPSLRPSDSQWYGMRRAITHAFFASEIASITGGRVLSTTRQRFVLDDHFLKIIDCVFFRSFIMANVTYLLSIGSRCNGLPLLSVKDSLWSFCSKPTLR